jgi:hypothetical protein
MSQTRLTVAPMPSVAAAEFAGFGPHGGSLCIDLVGGLAGSRRLRQFDNAHVGHLFLRDRIAGDAARRFFLTADLPDDDVMSSAADALEWTLTKAGPEAPATAADGL